MLDGSVYGDLKVYLFWWSFYIQEIVNVVFRCRNNIPWNKIHHDSTEQLSIIGFTIYGRMKNLVVLEDILIYCCMWENTVSENVDLLAGKQSSWT